jgi:hypothetical protein
MWRYLKCFYKDEPFVEVKFQVSMRRRPVIIGKNKFKSFKTMGDLILFLEFYGDYDIEVENEIMNKYSRIIIHKEFCLVKEAQRIQMRMRALYR